MTTTNTIHTPTTPSTFVPVKVERGRKFRGRGFIVNVRTYTGDYGWKQVPSYGGLCHWERNVVETEVARIWDPVAKRFAYANNAYVLADDTVSQAECDEQFRLYVEHTINSTLDWCRSVKPDADAAEIARFARNVLRKNHPEMEARINEVLPDQRHLDEEVAKTIAWAMTLRTRPMWMYGRMTKGGKPYSNERYVEIARKALTKRGFADKPEFEQVFAAECAKAGLK